MTSRAGRRRSLAMSGFEKLSELGRSSARRQLAVLPAWSRLWARDSALLLISQLLTFAATSLSAVLIARRLEPSDWGVFSGFLGLSFALAVFVEFGLATWLLRELSRLFAEQDRAAEAEGRRLISASIAFAVTVMGAIVALGTTAAAIHGMRTSFTIALALLLLYGGLFACANVLEPYLRAQRRLRTVVAASVVEKYVLVSLVVLFAVAGGGVAGIGVAYAVAGTLRFSILGLGVFHRAWPGLPSRRDVRSVLRRSLPFALMSGALTVVPRLDALCLLSLSAVAAGYFALGDRSLSPALLAPSVAATALYPFLARRAHRASAIWVLAGGFGLGGAVLGAIGFFLSPSLIPLVFGHRYIGAVPVVQIMLLGLPVIYAATPLMVYCYSCGRERAVVATAIVATLTGTGGIVAGQVAEGVRGAATGWLMRQILLLGSFAAIAVTAARAEGRVAEAKFPPTAEPSLR